MYKIMYPYNKFVWEKTIKQVNTQTKYIYNKNIQLKKLTFQNCIQIKKNSRFSYLK
jgi:hypothetical protein